MWGLGLHFVLPVGFWVGDGRSGTRMQDLDGTYADAGGIGGCPAFPFTHALGDLPLSRASLRGDIRLCISARPLSGTAYRLDTAVGGTEPHKGAKALHNRVRGLAEFLGEGQVGEAYTPG